MDLSFALFLLFAFLAVVLALEGAYNLWASTRSPEAKRIAERLSLLEDRPDAGGAGIERSREVVRLARLNGWIAGTGPGAVLARWVSTSGVATTPAELLILTAALAAFGLALPSMVGRPPVLGPALALVIGALPWLRVASRRNRRIERIERQFPEVLDLMGRSMRAGHAFPAAIKMVADEVPEPLGRDFRILFDEMNYGVPTHEALRRLTERVPLHDVGYFVVAVMIQREAGGNLAELLDNIARIVRQRLKLLGEVRTLSAEGRLSAYILTGLPFAVGLLVNLVNPEFMSLLWTDPLGHRMVGVALFMMVAGILWMRSIVRIRV